MSESSESHQQQAAKSARGQPVRCARLTVSDSRTSKTDTGGPIIDRFVTEAGHVIVASAIVRDDQHAVGNQIEQWLANPTVQAILITGGTGIAKRDTTIEVVRRLLTIELEGFGELFRMLSYQHVKAAAMMSRAVGGLVIREESRGGETLVFAMPGSPNAVETAMSNLIAPQLAHLVWERGKR